MSECRLCNDELLAQIQLSQVKGIGPRRFAEVLQFHGTAVQALESAGQRLHPQDPLGHWNLPPVGEWANRDSAQRILQQCRQAGIDVTTRQSADYPALLQEIHDPPPVLYSRGLTLTDETLCLAVVGTRFASPYGLEMASRFSRAIVQAGFGVTSGLARGIDAAAHQATLDTGGKGVAVLAHGLSNIYPPEHGILAEKIGQQGTLVSEWPPAVRPSAGSFPRRNRILSGLSLGVIVIEAPERSGALITAQLALEQGREVFAVPGPVNRPSSRGCHQLIRDGATLVENIDDILEQLGPLAHPVSGDHRQQVRHPRELALNDPERQILDAISTQPMLIDELIRGSELPAPQVLAILSVLESRKLVIRRAGQRVLRL